MERGFDGGLNAPVSDAQALFDCAMRALSRPGILVTVDPETIANARAPANVLPQSISLLLALNDADTRLWHDLDPSLEETALFNQWFKFHTGSTVTDNPSDADFALVTDPSNIPQLETFALGEPQYPDRSTTMVIECEMPASTSETLKLTGPGIKDSCNLPAELFPPDFVSLWERNGRLYPCGVDAILVSSKGFIGLPRTTRLQELGHEPLQKKPEAV